jgi:hypothetical protein
LFRRPKFILSCSAEGKEVVCVFVCIDPAHNKNLVLCGHSSKFLMKLDSVYKTRLD